MFLFPQTNFERFIPLTLTEVQHIIELYSILSFPTMILTNLHLSLLKELDILYSFRSKLTLNKKSFSNF